MNVTLNLAEINAPHERFSSAAIEVKCVLREHASKNTIVFVPVNRENKTCIFKSDSICVLGRKHILCSLQFVFERDQNNFA